MASITNPTPALDNNSSNSGAGIQTKIQTLYDNDSAINAELVTKAQIINGTGHAPAGTPVKMSWFEGTTGGSGSCVVAHGLGSSILGFTAYIDNGSGVRWYEFLFNPSDGLAYGKYYDNNNIFIQIPNSAFFSKPVRFLVWHK